MSIKKIRKEGGSRAIVISKHLPENWEFVTIESVKKTDNEVTLKICKVS